MADCVFCARIEAGHFDYFDHWNVAFQPLNPVTGGHFLVVPRKHVMNAFEGPAAAGRAMSFAAKLATDMALVAANFITSAGSAASQTVWHLHLHVVPRRPCDGLQLPWSQEPKCGYCYCPLGTSPECASGCGHEDRSGFAGCGRPVPGGSGA